MQQPPPLLVIERIEADSEHPHQVSAEVRIGANHEEVTLDLSIPTLVAFERMPEGLSHHRPARDAVIGVMMRRYRGEDLELPMDLSKVVRQASEPWPLRAPGAQTGDASDGSAASTRVALKQIEHDDKEPDLFTVRLDFYGVPTVVVVDRRGGSQTPLRFRFVEGIHPWLLTPAEQRVLLSTMLVALQECTGQVPD